ncbi:MAG: fumarylacetoacetate hydrolase [Candidatus Marinimicrobia bacterium]|nr:fumarylacetoacetate hydrolase [Candidatus Neomarinimicrobiota bacterium]
MRFATLKHHDREVLAVRRGDRLIPVQVINESMDTDWPATFDDLFNEYRFFEFRDAVAKLSDEQWKELSANGIEADRARFGPLCRHPGKIWGIGLNYREHADELDETTPLGIPGSFMKPATTIIGPGDWIHIPVMSEKTTGEAELGVVIGRECRNVSQDDWLSVVAGFTTIIDMTAEDILRQNVRYLTLSKSFDTFFSFGPYLITPDEIDDIMDLKVTTIINDRPHASNSVSNMTFPPDFLVSYHSRVMTLQPGDIISTGTPGAVKLEEGDRIECWIDGFEPLKNPVRDLKSDVL